MKIINKTRDTVIAKNVEEPKGIYAKSVGLLGEEDPSSLYFQTRFGIHTVGMKFPIDCIIADDDLVVRKLKRNLKPGKLFMWNPKYKHVVELPSGTIEKTGTKVLDTLSIKRN